MVVKVCVGSSCHLKGSEQIVRLIQQEVANRHLEDEVTLTGSFCTGLCNRVGVTITVDDEMFSGITVETFNQFFNDNILSRVNKET